MFFLMLYIYIVVDNIFFKLKDDKIFILCLGVLVKVYFEVCDFVIFVS